MAQDIVRLTDPRMLRAYAHPVRLRLVGLLRSEGPLTATRAAELLGESSGTTSFHLRQLAKFGLVEEAGGGVGRQRPWRATAQFTGFPDIDDTPAMAAASVQLRGALAGRFHELVLDWIARRAGEPEQWQAAAPFSDYALWLTAPELAALGARIEELLLAYVDRSTDPAARPAGSRKVVYLNLAMPAPGPEQGVGRP